MYFSIPAVVALFAVLGQALPTGTAGSPYLTKRALTLQSYNSMQISGEIAGDAAAKAKAIWTAGIDTSDLSKISNNDADILKVERENAEDAEAVFNTAISKASGAAKDALSVGKTQNKVFKLTGEVQNLEISLAKAKAAGKDTTSIEAALAKTQKKLTKNTGLDKANAGKKSTAVKFTGQTSV